MLIGIMLSFIRGSIEGFGYGSDDYDIYATYIKKFLLNTITYEEQYWISTYRWNNRVVFPILLAVLSVITSLEIIPLAVITGVIYYICSIIIFIKILEDREYSKQEIQIISSVFSVCPALLLLMTRMVTDGLFLFLTLGSIFYIQRYSEYQGYEEFLLACIFMILAVLTREIGFLIPASFIIFLIIKTIKDKKYFLTSLIILCSFLLILVFMAILEFTVIDALKLLFGRVVINNLMAGTFSLNDIGLIIFGKQNFYRSITIVESIFYTMALAAIVSLISLIEYDREKLVSELKGTGKSFMWIWFIILSFYLIFVHIGRMQARYWLPISFISYLGIPRGLNAISNQLHNRISKNRLLLILIIAQISISIIRIIFAFFSISLIDLLIPPLQPNG